MIRVGAINIDTTHPIGFAEAMAQQGRMRYVGVYNDSFRSDAEVAEFVRRYGLERRCHTLDELAAMCDIGFVQGCNWNDHLRCATPFFKQDKPVFIDKPLVGSLSDCHKVRALVAQGAVILGASSVRYAYELQEFLSIPEIERGKIITVHGTSGIDEFNYGIHIIEAIGGLLGTGAQAVCYLGKGMADDKYSETYSVHYASGQNAVYTTFTGAYQPFVITVITTKTTYLLRPDPKRLYAALMEQVANYMEGKPHCLADVEALLESVEIALAAAASRAADGALVNLRNLTETDPAYDGNAFCKSYSAAASRLYAHLENQQI